MQAQPAKIYSAEAQPQPRGVFVKGDDPIKKTNNRSSLVLPLTNSERRLPLLNQDDHENVLNLFEKNVQTIGGQANMSRGEFVLIFSGSTPEKIKKGCASHGLTHPVTFGLTITIGRLSVGKGKCFENCKKIARIIGVNTARPQAMIKQIYRFLNPKFQNLFLEYKVDFKPRYGHGKPAHQDLYRIIDSNRDSYIDLIGKALSYKDKLWSIQDSNKETDSKKPSWNNRYLPGMDIVAIYTLISEFKPKKYIEIGSGNSTKVAYKAKTEQNLVTEIVSIDPMPRAEIDNLADKVIREPFENIDIDFNILNELNENDILFVDNSHRILPNSDSMVFYLEILPKLKKGVIVHIHDIYLPYDYPQFMCDRFYSEQYGLAMYLLANHKKFEPLFPAYFIYEDKELSKQMEPIWSHPNLEEVERHGGAFWLRVNE